MKRLSTLAAVVAACGLVGLQPPPPGATVIPALIGYGCGPADEIMIAAEEDHFPTCDAIESTETLLYALEGDLDK